MITVFAIIAGAICFYMGWIYAHKTVAGECERLGGFFVGETTYRCVAVEPKGDKEPA